MPAVDDSPSSQLLLEQAADQSRANPREAVRLLVQALDAGPGLVVRSPRDPDLFVSVGARVHAMLAADPALREAYRKEVGPDADAQLARGELEAVFDRRLDTEAGLRAAMLLAEGALARGLFTQALACLERSADHDLLAAPRAARHAALLAEVRARLAVPAPGALAPGSFDRSFAGARWGQTWQQGFAPAPRAAATGPQSLPLVAGDRAFVDTGSEVMALDRLGGRALWRATPRDDAGVAGLHAVASGAGHLLVQSWDAPAGSRPGVGGLSAVDPATGATRWDVRLDRLAAGRALEGASPHGAPVVLDGYAVVGARKSSARFETVSLLAAVDLERPVPARWQRVIAASGSISLGFSRAGDSIVEAGGVIYLASATGAIAAVDAWDGRVRWIRRYPVPVRERSLADEPFAALAAAVVRGRVFAVTPGGNRIVALDAADGTVLAEIPTGADVGLGGPQYVVGDEPSGLVVVVGGAISGIHADRPATVAWTVDGGSETGPRGRVAVGRTSDPAAPVIAVPGEKDLAVLEMRDGKELLRIPWGLPANPVLAGAQVIAVSPIFVTSWMPVSEAERIVRARLAASDEVEGALAMLSLARQVRDAGLAADGAAEGVRRAGALPDDDRRRLELLDALLAVDRLDLGSGAPREAVERAVDEGARLAGAPERASLARAERALRRGKPQDAMRAAVDLAFAAAPGAMLPAPDGVRSPDAVAVRIVREARAADPSAASALSAAIDAAIGAAPSARRTEALRRGARLGAGTPAGDRALAACAAAASANPRQFAQLASECVSLGARPGEQVLAALGPWRDAAVARRGFPRLGPQAGRVVEFPGRLPRRAADAAPPPGGLLTLLGGDLVFRASPRFAPSWRVPVGGNDCSVIATHPDILVCDDGPVGTGRLTCIAPDGSVRWEASPGGSPAVPAASELDGLLVRQIHAPSVVAMPTASAVVVLRRDGSLAAFDRATGAPRWERPAGDPPPLAVARSPFGICVAEAVMGDEGTAIRVAVLDPADGTAIAAWERTDASEVLWMRVTEGGVLAVATDAGVEAHRLAGGDEEAPYWSIDAIEARDSERGWSGAGALAMVDGRKSIAFIDPWTGAFRPSTPAEDVAAESTVRDVAEGPGWLAACSRTEVVVYAPDGSVIGRGAPGSDRSFAGIATARGRVLLLDDAVPKEDSVEFRSGSLLRDLDVDAGGLERSPPLLLRSLIRRITDIESIDGAVAVGNGLSVQVVEFPVVAEGNPR